jgi:hypothetical protein
MAEDDDIARLLREVDAATGGGAPKASPTPGPAALPAARAGSGEVAKKSGGTGSHLLVAGGAGAVVGLLAAWIFGIIPFLGNSDTLRFVLAGFVGGAVGYGAGRFLDRR